MSQKLITEEQKLIDGGPPSKRVITIESERPKSPRDVTENDNLMLQTPQSVKKLDLSNDRPGDDPYSSDGSPPVIKYFVKENKTSKNKEFMSSDDLSAKNITKKKIKKQASESDANLSRMARENMIKQGTQIIATKNQFKIIAKDQIAKASFRRKILRLIIFISAFSVTILLLTLSFFLFSQKGSFTITSDLPFLLNIDSCNLVIYDRGGSESEVTFSYNIPGIYSKAEWTTNENEELLFENRVTNEQCFVEMYIDEAKILDKLTINCLSACNITQNSTLLNIQNELEIMGITTNANFRDIKARQIDFNVTKGYLQLNHITLTSASDNIISVNGDVIIQSTKSFIVTAQTDTQAFCFSAPELVPVSVTDCSFSGENTTSLENNNNTCSIVYNICEDGGCSGSMPNFQVTSTQGNIYANIIPKSGSPISLSNNVTKGAIYDQGIQLDPDSVAQMNRFNDNSADSSSEDPRITFSIGSTSSKSSASARWAITANPAYTYMKPWWIGAFTSSILNSKPVEFEGYLLPGICPFYNHYSLDDLYDIQTLIKSKLTSDVAITSMIHHPLLDIPPTKHHEHSGIFTIPEHRPFYKRDYWFTLIKQENNEIALDDNNLSKSPSLTGAIVLSFIISAIFTLILRGIVVNGLSSTYKEAWKFTRQLDNYSLIEQKKTGMSENIDPTQPKKKKRIALAVSDSEGTKEKEDSVFSLIKNPPHLMEYIDFLFSLMFYKTYNNSVKSFYSLLLRPIDEEVNDEEVIKNQRDSALGSEIKILYEKLCFLNGYCERRLTDQVNLAMLAEYGYEIKNSDKMIDVFVKINIKNWDDFFVHIPENGVANSLNLYMEVNVERTAFVEDQVKIDDFIAAYNRFCEFNRLTPVENINAGCMLDNFNIETQSVNEQVMGRIQEEDNILIKTHDGEEEEDPDIHKRVFQSKMYSTTSRGPDGKPKKCQSLRNCCKKKKKKNMYVIDTSRLVDHFKLLTGSFQDMQQNRLERAKIDLILNPLWQFEDLFSVVVHIFFILVFTVPLIILMVLTESQYTPWSQEDPKLLLRLSDLQRDPYGMFEKILNNGFVINYAILIIIFIFFSTVVIDTIIYYWQMEFPLNKFFDKHNKMTQSSTIFYRISYPIRVIPWICFFMIILFIFGYIFLLAIWLVLGAIIKPEIYLPYASAALTFIVFVKTKYGAFKNAIIDGESSLKDYLSSTYGDTLNEVLHKYSGSFIEMSKDVLKSSYIKSLANEVTSSGLMSTEDLERFQTKIEDSAANYIVGAIKDPKSFVTGIEGVVQNLRLDTTAKIKESCSKRGIPTSYVDLLGAISRKSNQEKIKHLREILKDCTDDQTEIDLVIELLFPESNATEEYGIFIAKKIIQLLLKKKTNKDDPQADILTSFICNYRNIQDRSYLKFISKFKSDLNSIDRKDISNLLEQWGPAVLMAIELCNNPKPWKISNYILELVNNTIGGDMVKFLKYYQVLASNGENIYDLCTIEYQNLGDITKIISDFWGFLNEKKIFGRIPKETTNFYSNLIILLVASARQEFQKIPFKCTREISDYLKIRDFGDYFPFCLKFSSTVHQHSRPNTERFNTSFTKYYSGKNREEFKEFIRLITSYYVEPGSFDKSICKNRYLVKLAKTINFSPEELLGLIDYLYRHHASPYFQPFLKSLLERRGIPLYKLDILQALLDFYLSPEEKVLLKASKTLELKYTCVLLVGRDMMNPKYLPKYILEAFNLPDNLMRQRETVWENKDSLANWKSQVKKEIDNNHSRDIKINPKLISLYLTEEKLNYTKTQMAEHMEILTNPKFNQLNNEIKSKELEFLWNFLKYIGDLRLSKEKEKLQEMSRENMTTVENLAKILKISANNLQSILSLFLEYDSTKISKFLISFYQEDKLRKDEVKRILDASNKFSYSHRINKSYLTKTLPDLLKFDKDGKYSAPPSFIESILTGSKQPRINDLLDIVNLVLKKSSGLSAKEIEDTQTYIFMMALFARELLPLGELMDIFNNHDEAFKEMSKNINKSMGAALTGISSLIPEGNPLKILLALYGIITRKEFKITRKFANRKAEELSQRQYLSDYLNIFPEFLILFEIAHEKDLKNFLSYSKTFMTRMNSNRRSKIDIEQIQSLMTLIQGDQHNYPVIAQKLGIPTDHVYFIISLMKIGRGDKTILNNLSTNFVHKARLTQLNIKINELTTLYPLVGNEIKPVEVINHVVTNLNLKKSIDIELLKGLQHLSSGNFDKLRTECTTFLSILGLDQDHALFLCELANGNYNILVQESQLLDWMFPADPTSKALKLATFLCAMVNNKADVKNYSSNPTIHNLCDPAFDFNAFWMSAFLLEYGTYKACEGKSVFPQVLLAIVLNFLNLPDQLRDLFTLIEWNHNLRFMDENQEESDQKMEPEAFKINEETKKLVKLIDGPLIKAARPGIGKNQDNFSGDKIFGTKIKDLYKAWKSDDNVMKPENPTDPFYTADRREKVEHWMAKNFKIDFEELQKIVDSLNLNDNKVISSYFKNAESVNRSINEVMLDVLYSLGYKARADTFKNEMQDQMHIPSHEFIDKLVSKVLDAKKKERVKGILYIELILYCYNQVLKISNSEQKNPGYTFTDLSIMSGLTRLRYDDMMKGDFLRLMYNVHLLVMNIERKFVLEDFYLDVNKFNNIKLMGASLGIPFSNVIEFSLPPSLITEDYLWKMKKNDDDQFKIDCKNEFRKNLVYEGTETILIGDLGDLGGTLRNYRENSQKLLEANWEEIKVNMDLKKKYYGDVTDPLGNVSSLKKNQVEYFKLVGQGQRWTEQSKLFISKSLLRMVYNNEGDFVYPRVHRLKYLNERFDPQPEHLSREPFVKREKDLSVSSIRGSENLLDSKIRNRASSNLMQIKEALEEEEEVPNNISKELAPVDPGKIIHSNTIYVERYQGKKKREKSKKGNKRSSKQQQSPHQEDLLNINDVVPSIKNDEEPDSVEISIKDRLAFEEETSLLAQFKVSEAHNSELETNVDSLIQAIDKTCDNIKHSESNDNTEEAEELRKELKDMKEKLSKVVAEKEVHIKNCEIIYGKLSTVRRKIHSGKPSLDLEILRDNSVAKGIVISEKLRIEIMKMESVIWEMKCSEEKQFLTLRFKWLRKLLRGTWKFLSDLVQTPNNELNPNEKEYELTILSETLLGKIESMKEREAILEEKARSVSTAAEKKLFNDQLHDYKLILDHIFFSCIRNVRKSRLSKVRTFQSVKPDLNMTESDKMDLTMDEEGPYVIDADTVCNNINCLRTNQTFSTLKRKSLEFELNLMNPNLYMIQKMIIGDERVLGRSDNAIGRKGRDIVEIYLALVKLQKIDINKKTEFKETLRHSLSNLKLGSDVNNLADILSYFLTQDVENLYEIGEQFDIKQTIMNILFIRNDIDVDDQGKFTKDSIVNTVSNLKDILELDEDEIAILTQMLIMFNRCEFDWNILIPGFLKRTTTLAQKEAVGYLVNNFIRSDKVDSLEGRDVEKKRSTIKCLIQNVLGPLFTLDEEKVDMLSVQFQILLDKIQHHNEIIYETMKTEHGKENSKQLWLAAGVKPENLDATNKIFQLQHIFSAATLNHVMCKPECDKEISEQAAEVNSIFLSFGLTLSDQQTQLRLCKMLLGVLSWNPGVMLKSMLSPNTTEDVYVLFSIARVFKFKEIRAANKDYPLFLPMKVLFSIAFKKFTFQSITSMLAQDILATKDMLEQELDCVGADTTDVIKALENKIDEFEKLIKNVKQEPYEYMNLVVEWFDKIDDQVYEHGYDDYLEALFDGSFIPKFINDLKSEDFERYQDFKKVINNSIKFSIKMFKWKNGQQVFPPECCAIVQEMVEVITLNPVERSILSEVASIIISILLFNKVSVKTSEIMDFILHLIVEFNPDVEDENGGVKEDFQYLLISLLNLFPGMSLTPGTKDLNINKGEDKEKANDAKKMERLETYYGGILLKFFPQLIDAIEFEDFKRIYRLTTITRTDFIESINNVDRKIEVIRDIEKELRSLKILTLPLEKLLLFIEGDISQLEIIATMHKNIPNENVESSIDYLKTIHNNYNLKFWTRLEYVTNTLKNNNTAPTDDEKWAQVAKKVKEGTATNKELYFYADQMGNKDGSINQEEFKMLASRLNIQLTDHRIQEIFAKIKGKNINGESMDTLDEKEFEKAMEYLQTKNVSQGLHLLGINSERLYSVLIGLIILLLLIFLFIFFGIRSFALGGTFGSIINSFFPAVGALGLGKQSPKPEQSLQEENIQEIGDKTKEITGSTQL